YRRIAAIHLGKSGPPTGPAPRLSRSHGRNEPPGGGGGSFLRASGAAPTRSSTVEVRARHTLCAWCAGNKTLVQSDTLRCAMSLRRLRGKAYELSATRRCCS